MFEPSHAKDDIITLEWRDDEIHPLGVGADPDADVVEDPDGVAGASISEAHSQRTLLRGESAFLGEGLRDEIARRPTIDEGDGLGTSSKDGRQLDEDAAAGLHLLNALR